MSFNLEFKDLPDVLPIFPLPRVILLPRVSMPLNIFEPRYVAMIDDAFKSQRLIGIVQRKSDDTDIYQTGCAGRIVSYAETEDGRYEVTLKGVCRFDIQDELETATSGYRRVTPSWDGYADDFTPAKDMGMCQDVLAQTMREYFDKTGLFCDQWDHMKDICCDRLIATLSVVCPLSPSEKQSLLEAKDLPDRTRILKQCLEEASLRATEKTKATICH